MTRPVIDALLETACKSLDRVQPGDLAAEIAAGALVVDTRPLEQRHHDGELPGALVIDRNILEWRLDPTSAHHIPEVTDAGQRIIIVCNEGYSSSLAAATLRQLGLERASDLVGGFQAWKRLSGVDRDGVDRDGVDRDAHPHRDAGAAPGEGQRPEPSGTNRLRRARLT